MQSEQEKMTSNAIEKDVSRLVSHVGDRLKLGAAVKSAKIIGVLILTIVLIMMTMVVLVITSLSIAAALTLCMPAWAAFLCVAVLDLVLMILMAVFNRPLVIDPLIGTMISILLERPIKVHEIELEQARLELSTEKDKIQLERDIEEILRGALLGWLWKLLRRKMSD